MIYLVLLAIILALVYTPQYWAQHTFKRYAGERDDIPGTGGELARHLLDRFEMPEVKVEATDHGDHYDPQDRTVRLSPDNLNGRSLTAIAVAAHEVGHAIQHHRKERLLAWRTQLVGKANAAQKIGAGILMAAPLLMIVSRSPWIGLIMLAAGLLSMGSAAVVHLITLPVEIDASFGKAMPILTQGGYIQERDHRAVHRILKAAAWTYLAASLASLLNIWRWIALFRR